MRKNILFLFLFLFNLSYAQMNIVFTCGDHVIDTDRILFKADEKYYPFDFYTEQSLKVSPDIDKKYYTLTIEKPTIVLVALTPDVRRYHLIYLNTADTIVIDKHLQEDSKCNYITFTGKSNSNYGQYNYDNSLDKWERKYRTPYYTPGTDLKLHKRAVKEWIEKMRVFNKEYCDKYEISESFRAYMESTIKSEYTFLLLSPILDGIKQYPKGYMDAMLDTTAYISPHVASLYLDWYRDKDRYGLTKMKEHINHFFDGDSEEYLLSIMMGKYADGDKVDSGELLGLVKEFNTVFNNPLYIDFINHSSQFFLKSQTSIPDIILQNSFVELLGGNEKENINNIFEKYKGKNIILDFWASWCSPCIDNIKNSYKIKNVLEENNIIIVYISIDKNTEKWGKKAEELNISNYQYRLLNIEESPIFEYLKIGLIPRYVYLNDKQIVVNLNGRAPLQEHADYFKNVFNNTMK